MLRPSRSSRDDLAPSWTPAPADIALGPADVHVWRTSLDAARPLVARLRALLSPDEIIRADRFVADEHQQAFVVARGTLRTILARYLNRPAGEIELEYTAHGKPRLPGADGSGPPVHFNLAHSGAIALYAVTRSTEVGIDLEKIRPDIASEDIARRFFSPHEVDTLNRLSPEERSDAFFHCWTRKEAFIKAKGLGLSLPLDQFDVSCAPGDPVRVLRTRWDESEAARWSLRALEPGPGYVGALAVYGHDWYVSRWQLTH